MLIRVTDEWKQYLAKEDEEKLNDILRRAQQHRHAYRSSKDIKTAQLWTALLEVHKDSLRMQKKLSRLEFIFDGILERIEKLKKEDEELLKSLERL